MSRLGNRLLLVAVLAAHSSCGAPGRAIPRPLAARSSDTANVQRAPRAAAVPAPPRPGPPPPRVPGDAWAEYEADEQAMRAAREQRYPLHGIAFHMMALVYDQPGDKAKVVGYMRRGTRFRAGPEKAARGCAGGAWHELAAGGFVCSARGVLVGKGPQTFTPVPVPAAVHDALPYAYAKNTARSVLQYWRLPSVSEEKQALAMLAEAAAAQPLPPAAPAPAATPDAGVLAAPIPLPDYARMAMEPGFYVSVDGRHFADDAGLPLPSDTACAGVGAAPCASPGRAFVRTVRGAYVPAASLSEVHAAPAPGVVLDRSLELPLGIVYRGSAKRLVRDPESAAFRPANPLPRYAHVALTGARAVHERTGYLWTRSGELVSESQLRVVQPAVRPQVVPPTRALEYHVRLAEQTLVAYEGERPVFATLVATGKEGWATPSGAFRIYAKHVSTTMDGLAGSEDAYSIEDVPWTMYFHGSYALHGAFWHDRFGAVRSHGCVNLAPADARWLFRWATPVLPAGFHGVTATGNHDLGTYVVIE